MPIIAAIILIISAFVGGAYLNKEGKVLPSSTSIKPIIEVTPTPTITPFPILTPFPMPSLTPTSQPQIYRPNPIETSIPTPTPNSGKEAALKAIEGKIARINQVIAAWQAQIDNLMAQGEQCNSVGSGLKDPYAQEMVRAQCWQQTFSFISQIEAKIQLLERERNELERQKFSIMAQ